MPRKPQLMRACSADCASKVLHRRQTQPFGGGACPVVDSAMLAAYITDVLSILFVLPCTSTSTNPPPSLRKTHSLSSGMKY